MDIIFLQASIPLTKTYTKQSDGSIEMQPYPNAFEFTSHHESCKSLADMVTVMIKHAALGNTMLKGTIARPLVKESRKGSTDPNGSTDWIVLDLDGVPGATTVDIFLDALGFKDISYIVQYSASYGIKNTDMRAHVFMQLAKPMAAPLLKQWLIDLNHKIDMLRNAIKLTKTGNALSWPLDITVCQNDKLIYIAPPILKGGLKDPMAKKKRIEYIIRKKATLDLTGVTIPSTETNKAATTKHLNELRAKDGLPARKVTYKMVGAHQIMVKPDGATVSDIKVDRGFVYFNLNGGDSWGYYHPENNPDFIFNFKGEPAYLTKELLPEYWEQLVQTTTKTTAGGVTYLTFLDRNTSKYYRGTYDSSTDTLELFQAANESQVRSFAKQHGVPLGDFIPEWDLVFNPHSTQRIDVANRTVNTYGPTEYGKKKPKPTRTIPTKIHQVILHAMGGDQEVMAHFINWLACIFQRKERMQTAWVLHGTEGTGKGALMHLILRPLMGLAYTSAIPMESLNEKYNEYLKHRFIIFIDEIEAKALNNEKGVGARLRNWIAEPMVVIRDMNTRGIEYENFANFIFASNKPEMVVLTKRDRRFNIAKFQPLELRLTEKEVEQIEKELQSFHDYLMLYAADRALAGKVLDTEDRQALISISETSIDVAVDNTLAGNLEFFVDQLPSDDSYKRNALKANKVEDYKEVLTRLMRRANPQTGACHITRDELQVLFGYTVGNVPETPNKFTSMLKHHRIHMTKVWVDNKAVQGISVAWADPKNIATLDAYVNPVATKPPKLKVVGKPAPKKAA